MKFSGNVKCSEKQLIRFLAAVSGLFVCLLAYYSKAYKWISIKFSGTIEDGTSKKPLNFGSDPWPVCLSISILLENL